MKIVYTVSLALIALLGASTTTTSAQEITAIDLDSNTLAAVDAPAEIGAEGDFATEGAANDEVDYNAEFIGAEATEGPEGDVLAETADVAEADREAVATNVEGGEVGAEGDAVNAAVEPEASTDDLVGADGDAGNTEVVTGDGVAAPASEVGAEGDLNLATLPVVRQNVIMTVNQKRKEAGLAQVCLSSKLMNTAQAQAIYQASTNSLTVNGKDGSSPSDRGRAAGFNSTGVAELVGAGYEKADDLINSWLQSADSKDILMGNYTHIGPGYTVYNSQQYKYYWAVDFSYGVGEACSGLVA